MTKEAVLEIELDRIEDGDGDSPEARLTVFTTDQRGDPLDGVTVTAESSDGAFGSTQKYGGVTTDGAVSIELPVAAYQVTAKKDGYRETSSGVAEEDFE